MKKKLLVLLTAFTIIASMTACQDETKANEETTAGGDWRNKIEYEGNFYVNRDTKLLYALDVGTITLWDNGGNGEQLQVLEYNSAESGAIESLEIEDFNGDGDCDISTVFSESEEGSKYNLWLWDSANGKYKECKAYRNVNNPVISEDKTTVTGKLDKGIFGTVVSTYTFTEELGIELTATAIDSSDRIAKAISNALVNASEVALTEGVANIQGVPCTVYAASSDGEQTAYIAHTTDSYWYIDSGCVGVYRMINDTDGKYTAGGYVDEAGPIADFCSELYKCDVSALTITEKTMGIIAPLSYNEEGVIILPEIPDGEVPDGMEAKGYAFSLDGKELCIMLVAENSAYYCYDPNLTGDQYFYLVSSSGEAAIVPQTASQYFIQ